MFFASITGIHFPSGLANSIRDAHCVGCRQPWPIQVASIRMNQETRAKYSHCTYFKDKEAQLTMNTFFVAKEWW